MHSLKLLAERVSVGEAASRHTILLLNPHPAVPLAGEASPAQLAATAKKKSLDTRKAGEDVPKVSALDDTLTHTHTFHIHTVTP